MCPLNYRVGVTLPPEHGAQFGGHCARLDTIFPQQSLAASIRGHGQQKVICADVM